MLCCVIRDSVIYGASAVLVKLLPVSSFFIPGSTGLAVSRPWRFSFGVLCQLYLVVRFSLMISIGDVMQIFAEIGVGYLVHFYKVEVCKYVIRLLF
ncbi:hypothetical protein Patl1_03637 [Pistacia atlantica]|uniref:Uncharacterized protein n=1 Tax=Pistacia atlantica TaxID=434234 RepID=A0ACC1CBI4_9ROSI|nr:hypothetical protein Patl1_03637 [Pistacia atlantica]